MSIQNGRQLDVTRKKLAQLKRSANEIRGDLSQDEHLKDLTLRSLKILINQLKEEIARFEAAKGLHAEEASPPSSRSV